MHVKDKEMASGLILPHLAFRPKLILGRNYKADDIYFEIPSSIRFLIFTLLCLKKLLKKGFNTHSKKIIRGT